MLDREHYCRVIVTRNHSKLIIQINHYSHRANVGSFIFSELVEGNNENRKEMYQVMASKKEEDEA